jgi:hypothetical protein
LQSDEAAAAASGVTSSDRLGGGFAAERQGVRRTDRGAVMIQLPEDHVLISFFECEPTVLDAGIPWAYNHLEFRTTRGADEFLASIEPGYETFALTWRREGRELVRLKLEHVCSLQVEMSTTSETLIVQASRGDSHSEIRLQLKPEPRIECSGFQDGV